MANNKTFVILIVIIGLSMLLAILNTTMKTASIVLRPSELAGYGNIKRVRVGGKVADKEIVFTTQPQYELKFWIENPSEQIEQLYKSHQKNTLQTLEKKKYPAIQVIYSGLKPDMFAAGRDVIIDGDYQNGILLAKQLLTQCPSKYEPPDPIKYNKKKETGQ
ncbi:MAG TPA: cytochrome c maturation protein CcmE [Oligoflexia bacterium]|nr:cytochrome c maturation protein CcmE [Oligoflexia bacterium]HMP27402.1 cytochrome c maturation protein CcmE [Oligoflexia bacterium]